MKSVDWACKQALQFGSQAFAIRQYDHKPRVKTAHAPRARNAQRVTCRNEACGKVGRLPRAFAQLRNVHRAADCSRDQVALSASAHEPKVAVT